MILKSWESIKLICGNHGDDLTNEMQIHEGREGMSTFYSCPCFKSIYGDNHDGRSCNNRLNTVDYERMLKELSDKAYDGVEDVNLTGYKWTKNGVEYKVLKNKRGKFTVSVLNKKAISR